MGLGMSLEPCPNKEVFDITAPPVGYPRLAWKSLASLGVLLHNVPMSGNDFPE